jgi:hypothetical protein
LAITSPTSGGRSVGIVRSRTQAREEEMENRKEREIEKYKRKDKK